jgi:hypothetical protein
MDMAAADINGVVTALGPTKLLTDLDATGSSSGRPPRAAMTQA